jgi:O-antigen/teichoic acid export membrane protein
MSGDLSMGNGEYPDQAVGAPGRSMLSRFIGGTLSMGVGTMATILLGLMTTVVVVRRLSPGDYGAYVLLQVGYVFAAEASSLGLTMAIPTFMAGTSDTQYREDFIKTVIYFRFLIVFLLAGVGLLCAPLVEEVSGSPLVGSLAAYGVLLFALESLGGVFMPILEGLFRFKRIAAVQVVSSGSYLILTVVFVVFFHRGILGVVQAKAASLVLSYGFAYLGVPRNRGSSARLSILKEALRFGLPLQLQYILDFAYNRVDTLIVGTLLGTVGVAYYEVARKIPQSLSGFYESFRAVYLPFVARLAGKGDRKKVSELLSHSLRWLSLVTATGALLALLFGGRIVEFLFSAKYASSVPAFILLMIGLNLGFAENTLGYSLIAIGEPDKPLRVNAVRAVVNLAGNMVLIPVFGFVGAALASLVGNVVAIPLDICFLSRGGISTRFSSYAKPILSFGVCAAGFLALGATSPVMPLAIIGLFGCACVTSSAVTKEDISVVARELGAILASVLHRPGFLSPKG